MKTNRMKIARRRHARLQREGKAVSPVVATLILILVAVAAAAALYLWLVAWQGGVTSGIGSPGAQATLTIGGSTSVYPFDQVAVQQFEQNQSDVVISNNQGGTGAGMLAVCHGSVNIGTASSLETVSGLQTNDGCPATTQITTFAYDAVDVIVPVANTHGLVSISYDTLALIYARATTGSSPTLVPTTINGVAFPGGYPAGALTWADIPAGINQQAFGGVTEQIESAGAGAGGAACGAPYTADICAATPGTTPTPCGWAVCTSGAANIDTVARSDASGTTQTFEARVLAANSATAFASSFANLGFSGCGSNNLIADCGYTATKTAEGNPGVIAAVASDANAIGYASDGLARLPSSGVSCQGVSSGTCGIGLAAPGQTTAVQPSLGATGTIAAGAILGGFGPSGQTTTAATGYAGVRPFQYVTTTTPTGETEDFIQFVLIPGNNLNFATESFEVSIYSV
jgi:flagellin-like protein